MTAISPAKINTVSSKESVTATHSLTKTDILLQRKNGCNQSAEKQTAIKKTND